MAGYLSGCRPDTQAVPLVGVMGPQKGVSPVWASKCDLGGPQRGLQATGNVLFLWGGEPKHLAVLEHSDQNSHWL